MIYTFECGKCKNQQDEFCHKVIKFGEKGPKCEKCGGSTVRIVGTPPNLRFQWARGRGFYATNSERFDD